MLRERALDLLPRAARTQVEDVLDAVHIAAKVNNRKVLLGMMPSVGRGLLLKKGKQGAAVLMKSAHRAHFDFQYQGDYPEMYDLYRRAVAGQWDAETTLDWTTDVDPHNPDRFLLPLDVVPAAGLAAHGIHLDRREQERFLQDVSAFILSQFLHGEHGALYASCQVTESVQWFDGKLYGATQVMDEARHVEVFLRYLETKIGKLYQVNDNLFTIIDALMTDARWDMKFLGMQIMVEGLALGAFSTMYQTSREPLLRELLKYVIQDEARHVHYGVLALKRHLATLSEAEIREREDWAFEVALLMRNRFLAHEVYEEWFSHRLRRRHWDALFSELPFMREFRRLMFKRLIPNLEYIGLFSDRIRAHYAQAGLTEFAGGRHAGQLSAEDLLADVA
ncbi:MAG: ferritin-like domain-containing protein [Candidatus Binatia bacterium]